MAETSKSLTHVTLSGNAYLASEVTNTLTDGDLRLNPPENPQDDPYIKVEFLWEGQWHEVDTWYWYKELLWYKPNWSDPWALIKIYQRLLKNQHAHLEFRFNYQRNALCVRKASEALVDPWVKAAHAEATQLLARNRS
jgi:hypothetical protein